jgi:hypothetical protein
VFVVVVVGDVGDVVQLEVKQPALFFIPCIGGDVVQLEVNNQNYSSFLVQNQLCYHTCAFLMYSMYNQLC